jgi:hypothetical protein
MALHLVQNQKGLIEGRHISGSRCAFHLRLGHIKSGPTIVIQQIIRGTGYTLWVDCHDLQ